MVEFIRQWYEHPIAVVAVVVFWKFSRQKYAHTYDMRIQSIDK